MTERGADGKVKAGDGSLRAAYIVTDADRPALPAMKAAVTTISTTAVKEAAKTLGACCKCHEGAGTYHEQVTSQWNRHVQSGAESLWRELNLQSEAASATALADIIP